MLCLESNISAFGILVGLDIKYFARFRIDEVLVFVDEDLVPTTVGLPDSKVAIARLHVPRPLGVFNRFDCSRLIIKIPFLGVEAILSFEDNVVAKDIKISSTWKQ